jgi:hypothetical protein
MRSSRRLSAMRNAERCTKLNTPELAEYAALRHASPSVSASPCACITFTSRVRASVLLADVGMHHDRTDARVRSRELRPNIDVVAACAELVERFGGKVFSALSRAGWYAWGAKEFGKLEPDMRGASRACCTGMPNSTACTTLRQRTNSSSTACGELRGCDV